jgi:hypothetical protein
MGSRIPGDVKEKSDFLLQRGRRPYMTHSDTLWLSVAAKGRIAGSKRAALADRGERVRPPMAFDGYEPTVRICSPLACLSAART